MAVSAADMATVDALDTVEVAEDAAATEDPAAGRRLYRVGYTTTLGSVYPDSPSMLNFMNPPICLKNAKLFFFSSFLTKFAKKKFSEGLDIMV